MLKGKMKDNDDASSRGSQPDPFEEPDSISKHRKPGFFAHQSHLDPKEHGLGGPWLESDDSVNGDGSLSHDQGDEKSSFTSYNGTQQEEDSDAYPDEDKEFIANTRAQTPKEDVVRLKWDLIHQRRQIRRAKRERSDFIADQERIRDKIHADNEEQLQKEVRGRPRPRNLGSELTQRPLYDGVVDRLRECTVLVLTSHARDTYDIGEYQQSESHARQAHDVYATELDYEPLSAWCQLHIGKAQYGQKRYGEALLSLERARQAIGFYVAGEVLAGWESKITAAEAQMPRSGTSSAESMAWGESLADQLLGRGYSGSSNGSG